MYGIDTPRNGLAFYRKARHDRILAVASAERHAETSTSSLQDTGALIYWRKCTATAAPCFRPTRCTHSGRDNDDAVKRGGVMGAA